MLNEINEQAGEPQEPILTDGYTTMIDDMLATEHTATYIPYNTIKELFRIYPNRSDQ